MSVPTSENGLSLSEILRIKIVLHEVVWCHCAQCRLCPLSQAYNTISAMHVRTSSDTPGTDHSFSTRHRNIPAQSLNCDQ